MPFARSGSLGVALLGVLLLPGCQKASRFTPPRPTAGSQGEEDKQTVQPADFELTWRFAEQRSSQTPLHFVSADLDPSLWRRLPGDRVWHDGLAKPPIGLGLFGLIPLEAATRLTDLPETQAVLIRVPRGLPDPRGRIPTANPATRNKWLLGRRLFFDASWMTAAGNLSCKDCHPPERGYTDGRVHNGFRTPSLLNCLYNDSQFADGRVTYLEEVVAQSPEDERDASPNAPFRHAWGGVGRLLGDPSYVRDFQQAFGCRPTQDTVGKALATYLRTLLSGNSLHDRALAERLNPGDLIEDDYQRLLNDAELTAFKSRLAEAGVHFPPNRDAAFVAGKVLAGYRAFLRRDPESTSRCAVCHSGATFSDQEFHNLGVGAPFYPEGENSGRFRRVPIGLRENYQVGAFKTPRLRSLSSVGPYMHNDERSLTTLEDALAFHLHGGLDNTYLDPVMRDIKQRALAGGRRPEADTEALTVFLVALQGEPLDAFIRSPPER